MKESLFEINCKRSKLPEELLPAQPLQPVPRKPGSLLQISFILLLLITSWKGASANVLLIICPTEFADALQPLADHKERYGISTDILTFDLMRIWYRNREGTPFVDEAERIKWAIYRHYRDFDTRYVMLVGDCNVFPTRYTLGDLDDYSPDRTHGITEKIWEPSDLYYADVVDKESKFDTWDHDSPPNGRFGEIYRSGVNWDSVDYNPDVYVGRVPADTIEEVQNYVAKVIRYEYTAAGQPWFNQMVLSVHDSPDWDTPDLTEHMADTLGPSGFSFTRYYHHDIPSSEIPGGVTSDGDPTAANIATSLNNGAGFMFHHGHGDRQNWQGCFGIANVLSLTNTYRLPLIFCISCETARFCPYVPYDLYLGKDGNSHGPTARGSIGTTVFEEPEPVQWDSTTGTDYNRAHTIGEEFIVGSEGGAIAYWGCTDTGESTSNVLGRDFFFSYGPGATLGEMWMGAIYSYRLAYDLGSYNHGTTGGPRSTWTFHTPERFILFGDPSLHVGGIPGAPADTTPPVTTDNIHAEWYASGFNLNLTPTDDRSGVHHTYLQYGGSTEETRHHVFTIPPGDLRTISFNYYSVDFFGNQETPKNTSVKLESRPPTIPVITLSGDPPTTAEADFGGPVTVALNSSDADSGMRGIFYSVQRQHGPYFSLEEWGYVENGESFEVNGSGRYRILASAEDMAGNSSDYASQDFSTFYMEIDPRFDRLADILAGPIILALPPKLELPFKPFEVSFAFQRISYDWTVISTDTEPQDGWSVVWDTQKFPDGIYNVRAVARGPIPKNESANQQAVEKVIPMTTYAVLNRPASSYIYQLDESPRKAGRGEMVEHTITFQNKSDGDLNNTVILFDLAQGGQYDLKPAIPYDGGNVNETGTIQWNRPKLKTGEIWKVRFAARAKASIPSGDAIFGYASLHSDEIPVITTDDPSTPKLTGDPSSFVVHATGGAITGTVRDSYLLQPLPSTTVRLEKQRSTVTDETGRYVFGNLEAATYVISASRPPVFGEERIAVVVDGATATADLVLNRNDCSAPNAFPDELFEDLVAGNITEIKGQAKDNRNGTGVSRVEAAISRLSDRLFWNGKIWQDSEHRFVAKGTEEWEVALTGLKYQPDQAYVLILWTMDNTGNDARSEFHSRPPAPNGLSVTQTPITRSMSDTTDKDVQPVKLTFSWNPVPGCGYLLEVGSNQKYEDLLISKYVDKNEHTETVKFPDGSYYWRVYSFIGTNIFSRTPPWQGFTITSSGNTPTPTSTITSSTITPTATETPIISETPTEINPPTPTETQTPTPLPTETHTSSPTPTPSQTPTIGGPLDYDIYPDTPDGQINAGDLVRWLERLSGMGNNRSLLFDFARFWKSQFEKPK